VSSSSKAATVSLKVSFGKCGSCKKTITNPLTHVCAPRSDFRARKRKAARRDKAREREAARKKRQAEKHDYATCKDDGCKRSLCVAYKTGCKTGYQDGFGDGFGAGHSSGHREGFAEGLASCPGPHGGG
jgi:hypothetical protein